MTFIVAAVKLAHFNFDYLIKTLLKYYYHLHKCQRYCLYHRTKHSLNPIPPTLSVSYATAFAIRKLILMPSLLEPSPCCYATALI